MAAAREPARPNRRVRLLASAATLSLAGGLLAVALPAAPALADIKAQIASAKAQLASLNSRAEAIAEKYNASRIAMTGAQRDLTAAQNQVRLANQRISGYQQQVGQFAAAAYRGESNAQFTALIDGDPQASFDRLAMLGAISRSESRVLARYTVVRHQQLAAQSAAAAALRHTQAVTAQINDARKQVAGLVAKQQHVLKTLQAKEAAIERAARLAAERAREAAARAAALREAQQAAAARASYASESSASGQGLSNLDSQSNSAPPSHIGGSGGARVAVEWAYRELGKPYQWGAEGPNSFDCSGLTKYVWGKAGVYLDHYTGSQWNEGRHVSQSQLEPGDLVFFGSDLHHVGIYVGNGNMIEAPYTGANVRVSPYDRPDYAGAVRPG